MSQNPTIVTATTDLLPSEALALAQFVKRCGWSDLRSNAVDDDEAYEMRAAIQRLQRSLADAGYAPR